MFQIDSSEGGEDRCVAARLEGQDCWCVFIHAHGVDETGRHFGGSVRRVRCGALAYMFAVCLLDLPASCYCSSRASLHLYTDQAGAFTVRVDQPGKPSLSTTFLYETLLEKQRFGVTEMGAAGGCIFSTNLLVHLANKHFLSAY